jgi:hypothetical protein
MRKIFNTLTVKYSDVLCALFAALCFFEAFVFIKAWLNVCDRDNTTYNHVPGHVWWVIGFAIFGMVVFGILGVLYAIHEYKQYQKWGRM